MKKTIFNPNFEIYPERGSCFKIIFPVDFEVGTVFTGEEFETSLSSWRYRSHNLLKKVTKIENLKNHPDHIVVSSILVGSTISEKIHEFTEKSFCGAEKGTGKEKLAVVKYFNKSHVDKEDCCFEKEEKTDIFFISTNGKPVYYVVDISKLDKVTVPIENVDKYLGY